MIDTESFIFIIFICIFGLVLGSFLNVVIYRLPRKESIVFPPSYCPLCKKPIKYFDNIPILSFLILGGQCRSCSAKISWIYPLIEFITVSMGIVFYLINGFSINFFADYSLGSILLVAAIIDTRYMIIPDRLNFTGVIIAIFISFWRGFTGIKRGIAGAFLGLLVLIVMYVMGKMIFKREGVGFGDVKLAFVIGFFLGPFWCLMALILAIMIGGIWGIIQLASGGKKIGMQVPFGPFLALGGFLVLFFREQIIYLVEQYLSIF